TTDAIDRHAQDLDPQMRAELEKQSELAKVQMRQQVNDQVQKAARKVLDWTIEPSDDELDYLTKDHPAMISAFLIMLMMFVPFLTCLGGFNQTAGDIDTKGLRYLLIRTERSNIFLGRLIGTYLFAMAVFLILFLVLGAYMASNIKVHSPGEMLAWMASGYLRVMLFVAPYMAVCAWISCAIASPFGSLAISLLIVYFYPLIIYIGSKSADAISYGNLATPWGYKWWLFAPLGPKFFGGIAMMIAFTALFTFLGHRYFGKRDL
ncbi:MAG TPA: hypothetical protein VLB44_18110, partial [Kofleriaceae bacterium]|nr:hypothetical protein [Kofleriaceae bacterium]